GSLEAVDHVTLNPSGQLLAWVVNDGKSTQVTVLELATRKTLRNFAVEPGFKVRDIDWGNDHTLLFSVSATLTSTRRRWPARFELGRWLAADVSTGRLQLLLTEGNKRVLGGSQLVRRNLDRPDTVIMSSHDYAPQNKGTEIGTRLGGKRRDSGYQLNAFEMNIVDGKSRLLESGTPFTNQWLADAKGNAVVRSEWNAEFQRFTVVAKDGASWKRILEVENGDESWLAGMIDNDTAVAVVTHNADQRTTLWSVPVDGSPAKKLVDDSALEVEGIYTDPFDDRVVGVRLGGAERPKRWIDPDMEKRVASIGRTFAGKRAVVESRSADNKRFIVEVEDASSPPVYYLIDYVAKKADIVGDQYPGLADQSQGTVRQFAYKARDDYGLFGYLTIPPGATEKNLPLVVLPHGGPHSRDTPDFDWWSQFLASRGYAVLRPQFRGSTGLGTAHLEAGKGQWGLRMQDDITDGVKALVAQGIVDPKRVCIVGASYGGYAALAGAAFTPELYACAVSVAGISDLGELIAYEEKMGGDESNSYYSDRESIGTRDEAKIGARSPARHARNIRVPILLIHGSNDSVVPFAQSQMMDNALTAAGVPHQLVTLDSEDHWLSSSVTRTRLLSEIEKFLAVNLAPRH
ncbi:MAG TPA: alpha/beta fold hydrolase, partial [Steroidobacteraceae bacterium]|nr:alpha/beta fold hydrolase [Steroidobacteraceae bacterium]